MAEEVTKMKLKVDLQCGKCYRKVKKLLCKFPQIRDQIYDEKQNIVTVTVVCCDPEKIRDKLCCKGGGYIKSIEIVEPPKPKPPPEKPPKKPEKPKEPPKEPEKPEDKGRPPKPKPPSSAPKPPEQPVLVCPPTVPPLVAFPVGVCWVPCYEGRPGGPCFEGCGRPPPPPPPCHCDGYWGRPICDSYGGSRPCYVSRCDQYFS